MPKSADSRRFTVEALEPRLFLSAVPATDLPPSGAMDSAALEDVLTDETPGDIDGSVGDIFAGVERSPIDAIFETGEELAVLERQSIWNSMQIPDGTVFQSGQVHQIKGSVMVPAGAVLTIEPGAIIKFDANSQLEVIGTVNAVGTAENKIIFTSLRDDSAGGDTNGDGATTLPAAGDWHRVRIVNSGAAIGNIQLSHAEFRYGGRLSNSRVTTLENNGGTITITNSVVRDSYGHGIALHSGASTIQNTDLGNLALFGIYAEASQAVSLTNNSIVNAASGGLRVRPHHLLAGNSISGSGLANFVQLMGGDIPVAGLWDAGLNYYMAETVRVAGGVTLEIAPGRVVKFAPNVLLEVIGSLRAEGTAGQKIILTSFKDDAAGGDTNGDGNASAPVAGDWQRLRVVSISNQVGSASLSNVEVRYAGRISGSQVPAVENNGGSLSLVNSSVQDSYGDGVGIYSGTATVSNITVNRAGLFGIRVDSDKAVTVNDNSISNALSGPLRVRPQTILSGNTSSDSGLSNFIYMAGGDITDARSWNGGLNYFLPESITVSQTGRLELRPGLIIKMGAGQELRVAGELTAPGTVDSPIYFTSFKDDSLGGDTNGDGAVSVPAAGDWSRLYVGPVFSTGGGQASLSNVILRYGGKTNNGTSMYVLEKNGGAGIFNISDVAIEKSFGGGITVNAGGAVINNSRIQEVNAYAIRIDSNEPFTLTNNIISDAAAGGIRVRAGTPQIISGNTITNSGLNNFVHFIGGNAINDARVWNYGPYYLSESVTIGGTGSVQVAPGTIIKVASAVQITVQGQFSSLGTTEDRIYFTSFKDDTVGGDTNGDGNASAPAAGDWDRIYLRDDGPNPAGTFDHTEIRYGGKLGNGGGDSGLSLNGGQLTFRNSVIRDSFGEGIWVVGSGAAIIEGSRIENTARFGVRLDVSTANTLNNNTFVNAGSGPVRMQASTALTATGNTSTGSGRANAYLVTAGDLPAGQIWNDGISTYILEGTVRVQPGNTLQIAPGRILKMQTAAQIDVEGQLVARGTTEAPIFFTSIKDDTRGGDSNSDGIATTPSPGDWDRIFINSSATASALLEHVRILYAGKLSNGTPDSSISLTSGSIDARNLLVQHGAGRGVWIETGTATVTNSTISDVAGYGLYIADQTRKQILTGNHISRAAVGAVFFRSDSDVDLAGTTWAESGRANAITVQGGSVSGTKTWRGDAVYWIADENLTIGGQLTVEAGAIIKLQQSRRIEVNGTFIARGEEPSPQRQQIGLIAAVIITSFRDDLFGGDTNGDGPSAGQVGDIMSVWQRGGLLDLSNFTIANGGAEPAGAGVAPTPMILIDAGQANLNNVTIRNGFQDGIRTRGSGRLVGDDILIDNVDGAGVALMGSQSVSITGLTLQDVEQEAVIVSPGTAWSLSDVQIVRGGKPFMLVLGGGTVNGHWSFGAVPVVHFAGSESIGPAANGSFRFSPGTILKAPANFTFAGPGPFYINGNDSAPVVFTSLHDDRYGGDSNGNGIQTTPAPGDWGGIFVSSPLSRIDNALITNAGRTASFQTADVSLQIPGGAFVQNTIITRSFGDGILVAGPGVGFIANSTISDFGGAGIVRANSANSDLLILNNTIAGGKQGVFIQNTSATLVNNIISGNSEVGLLAQNSSVVVNSQFNIYHNPAATSGNFFHQSRPNWVPNGAGDLFGDPLLSVDPLTGEYLLQNGSPAIDSGMDPAAITNPSFAPFIAFASTPMPRNDTAVPNTGTGPIPFFDRGAYERPYSGSPIDIQVSGLDANWVNRAGALINPFEETPSFLKFDFSLFNAGTVAANINNFTTSFFIRPTNGEEESREAPATMLQGVFVTVLDLAPGETNLFSYLAPLPILASGFYRAGLNIDVTDLLLEKEPLGESNNTAVADEVLFLQNRPLSPGVPFVITDFTSGDPFAFEPDLGPGGFRPFAVALNSDVDGLLQFAGPGAPAPFSVLGGVPVAIDVQDPGMIFQFVPGEPGAPGAAISIELNPFATTDLLQEIFPRVVGNAGQVTLQFLGGPFMPGAMPGLVHSEGTVLEPLDYVHTEDGRTILGVFDLRNVPPGPIDPFVLFPNGDRALIPDRVTVVGGGFQDFQFSIQGPDVVRADVANRFRVSYTNPGLVDLPMHVVHLDLPDGSLVTMEPNGKPLNGPLSFFAFTPYSTNTLTLPTQSSAHVDFWVSVPPGDPDPVITGHGVSLLDPALAKRALDLGPLLQSIKPANTNEAVWNKATDKVQLSLGATVASAFGYLAANTAIVPGWESDNVISPETREKFIEKGAGNVAKALGNQIGAAYPPSATPQQGDGTHRDFVIIIAIEDYRSSFVGIDYMPVPGLPGVTHPVPVFNDDLPGTQEDASTWLDFFSNDLWIPEDQIIVLRDKVGNTDDNVTFDKIQKAWRDTVAKADADDKIKFVYSGHGSKNGGALIMNTPYNQGTGEHYASSDEFRKMLTDNPMPGEMYFVFDSCYSGQMGEALNGIDRLRWNSAVNGSEWAADGSSFSGFLVGANKDKINDANGDGKVFISEAFNAAGPQYTTAHNTEKIEDQKHPQSGGDNKVDQELHDDQGDAAKNKSVADRFADALRDLGNRITEAFKNAFAIDPNEKTGPAGYGAEGYIPGQQMFFSIYFENDPDQANAAAQVVTITDQLDPDLDWKTLEFGTVTIGELTFELQGTSALATAERYLPLQDVIVRIEAGLDQTTGVVRWTFSTLDVITHRPTLDPLAGFLPPNKSKPEGEGHVNFTIHPKASLPHGTAIQNKAEIVFDTNDPIITNELAYRIDREAPIVSGVTINGGSPSRSHIDEIRWAFEERTSITVNLDRISLTHTGTGQRIPLTDAMLTKPSDTVVVLNLRSTNLSAGEYVLVLDADGAVDASGFSLPVEHRSTFHVTPGDATGDKIVNLLDLYRVWQNQLKPVEQRDSSHDLNRDGAVTVADLEPVRNNFVQPGLPRQTAGLSPGSDVTTTEGQRPVYVRHSAIDGLAALAAKTPAHHSGQSWSKESLDDRKFQRISILTRDVSLPHLQL